MRLGIAVITIVDGGTATRVVGSWLFNINHDRHRLFCRQVDRLFGWDLLSLLRCRLRLLLLYLLRLIFRGNLFGFRGSRSNGDFNFRRGWGL